MCGRYGTNSQPSNPRPNMPNSSESSDFSTEPSDSSTESSDSPLSPMLLVRYRHNEKMAHAARLAFRSAYKQQQQRDNTFSKTRPREQLQERTCK